ncbi:phage portal protein, HK97 family [Nakamurella panacisegetis]|uniref:Phage portal protein, HK97 family n=1 Tax=Nakamurella panacisegetis TaxID=1090615 RepID=A0A1H0NAT4_9ACTN|nr:phage portal protein, HK97 family [Nakamurella panacisegetis]
MVHPLDDGFAGLGGSGRLNSYSTKQDQLAANLGWCFAANSAIVDPTAAVELKLYKIKKDGDREEVKEHEILDLLDNPNNVHTGEQMRHLHFTYMNFVGESYIHMLDRGAADFVPAKGKLPLALEIFPAHLVQFKLGTTYTGSTVKYSGHEYPLPAFIRDLNPDPANPFFGRSIVKAGALAIDTDEQMKQWNRGVFDNGARPSLIFSTNDPLSDDAYNRWKQQFVDEHTGTENAHKPLLIEGGDAKPYMLSPTDLDFLASREFSMKEILSMWRLSPGMLGQVENVNRANLDAGIYMNGITNVVPRIRQFVRQLNVTLVKVYDPTLELDFVNPVPEDQDAKLKTVTESVGKIMTINEGRAKYGMGALPDGLGETLYMSNTNAPLASIADGTARPPLASPPVSAPPASDTPKKSHVGVKKTT